MKIIKAYHGFKEPRNVLVDDDDFEYFNKFHWTYTGYVSRHINGIGSSYMHREVMLLKRGDKMTVDHLNHDPLDNRKENLEVVTQKVNKSRARNKKIK